MLLILKGAHTPSIVLLLMNLGLCLWMFVHHITTSLNINL